MAAAFASRGLNVVGVDVNQHAVNAVNDGRAPVQETDLETTIAAHQNRIRATLSHEDAVLNPERRARRVLTPVC